MYISKNICILGVPSHDFKTLFSSFHDFTTLFSSFHESRPTIWHFKNHDHLIVSVKDKLQTKLHTSIRPSCSLVATDYKSFKNSRSGHILDFSWSWLSKPILKIAKVYLQRIFGNCMSEICLEVSKIPLKLHAWNS